MNILHINPYSENILYDNLYELQSESHNISVYVPLNKSKRNNTLEKKSNYNKKYSYVFSDIDRILFFRKNKKICKDIEKIYNLRDIDIIHAHTLFSSGYVAYKFHLKYGIPYIVTIQNTDVNIFMNKIKLLNGIGKKIIRNASKVVFISNEYKKHVWVKYGFDECMSGKIIVIPYGIDEYWINKKYKKDSKTIERDIKLLTVAEINDNKNQILVCKICEELIKKGYHVTYSIVGNITDKNIYEQVIKKEYVNYLGFKNKEELMNIYRDNDIFIMLSKSETFGLVYAESMSQGLPIIYTKGEGFDGNFDDGYIGKAVDISSKEDILYAVDYILNNYDYLISNAYEAVNKFDWKNISDAYEKIYIDILRGE